MSVSQNSEPVTAPLHDWLRQGADLYDAALNEYHSLERDLEAIEARLTAKRAEVNQLGQLLGKPAAPNYRRLSALAPDEEPTVDASSPIRVMAGRFARTGR